MGDWLKLFRPEQKEFVAKQDNIYVARPKFVTEDIQHKNSLLHLKNHFNSLKNVIFQKDLYAVKDVMENDKDAVKNLQNVDKDKLAEMILEAAYDAKVDPVIIAHIASQESHFDQYADSNSGKGLMQITPISVKDMYQHPDKYESELLPILKKYKTHEKLFEAAKKDPELNLKLGAHIFKLKLNKAHGNVRKALELYKGCSGKYAYAEKLMKKINDTKKHIGLEYAA